MPGLFSNLFDSIVAGAYSMPPTTPPFMPPMSGSERTTYDLRSDPGYAALEEELKRVLRANRRQTKRGTVGNILRAGLSAAAAPNRAFGGPMDVLASIAGGMEGHQRQDILQDKLFEEEQARQAKSLQSMLQERRQKSVANAQAASDMARGAYYDDRRTRPTEKKFTGMSLGSGLGMVLGSDGSVRMVGSQAPTESTAEKERAKANAQVKAMVDGVLELGDLRDSGVLNDEQYRSAMFALTKDKGPEVLRDTWQNAAREQLPTNATRTEVMKKAAALEREAKPKATGKGGSGKLTQGEVRNNEFKRLEREFVAANPGVSRGSTTKSIAAFYASMLNWLNGNQDVKDSIVSRVAADVMKDIETRATKAGKRGVREILKDVTGEVNGEEDKKKPLKVGDVIDGFKYKGGDPKSKASWEKVKGGAA